MPKGLPRSLGTKVPKVHHHAFSASVDITGVADAVDAGEVVIAQLPVGNLLFKGAVAYVTVDGTDAHVVVDWAGDFSVGTVSNSNDVDVGDTGEANIIPSTALVAASGLKVTDRTRAANATAVILDNTDGSLELNFNLLIDDNVITDAAVGTFSVVGEIWLAFEVLGDD